MSSFGPGLAFSSAQSLKRSFSSSIRYLWALFSIRAHLARGSSWDQSVDVQAVPVASNRDRWWWFVVLWSVVRLSVGVPCFVRAGVSAVSVCLRWCFCFASLKSPLWASCAVWCGVVSAVLESVLSCRTVSTKKPTIWPACLLGGGAGLVVRHLVQGPIVCFG